MGIHDLTINPVPGRGILHGYLGITSTVQFKGTVDFTCKKLTNIRSLSLTLDGYYKTSLVIVPDLHEEKLNFIYRSTILMDSTVSLYSDRVDSKHAVIVLPPGQHSIPFTLDIPEDVCAALPASFTTTHDEDIGMIRYDLMATCETLPTSWIGSGKVKTVVAETEVDVPKIQSEVLLEGGEATMLKNEDSTMDYTILISSIKFGVDQPVNVMIEELIVHYCNVLADIEVGIRQHEVLRCNGQSKTYTPFVAEPPKKLKYKKKWSAGSWIVKNAECSVGVLNKTRVTQAVDSPLLTVFHVMEVLVRLKDGRDVKIEAPMVYTEGGGEEGRIMRIVERADGGLVELED